MLSLCIGQDDSLSEHVF